MATAIVIVAMVAIKPARAADPLPLWNDGPTKQAIVAFVEKVTKEGSPGFVPVAERIATFDNDGTLWCEHPVVQLAFAIDRLKVLVDKQPQLREKPAVAAALTGNMAYFEKEGEHAIAEIVFLTHAGMTVDEFQELATKFFKTAKHPKYGVLLKDATHLPMRKLLAYLRNNGFKTYICSGGGIEFMRAVSQEIYGIPQSKSLAALAFWNFRTKTVRLCCSSPRNC